MILIVKKIYYVVYCCKDVFEIVCWYEKYFGMKLVLLIVEDVVFFIGEFDFYMYIFFDVGMGNVFVFFELFICMLMGCDQNILVWIQYLVLQVELIEVMMVVKVCFEVEGIEVVGFIDYVLFQLIYFYDFNGYCFEFVVNIVLLKMYEVFDQVKWVMLEEWVQMKKVFKYVVWMYDGSYKEMFK